MKTLFRCSKKRARDERGAASGRGESEPAHDERRRVDVCLADVPHLRIELDPPLRAEGGGGDRVDAEVRDRVVPGGDGEVQGDVRAVRAADRVGDCQEREDGGL